MPTPLFVRNYRTIAPISENSNKGIGDSRHYAPAIKEWSDSIYTFNKNEVKNLVNKDNMANDLIKMYFDMDTKSFTSTKSKRMRNFLKRSSTRKLFVSKSQIKQTNDKAIVNLFIFDRSKKKLNKKLFYLKNSLNKIVNNRVIKKSVNVKRYPRLVSKYNVNHNNYSNLLALSYSKKKQNLKSLFFFYFLKWSLAAFKVHTNILKNGDTLILGNAKRTLTSNIVVIYTKNSVNTSFLRSKIYNSQSALLTLDSKESYKTISYSNNITINKLKIINEILYKYLYVMISKSNNNPNSTGELTSDIIYRQFKFYKNTYYKVFIERYMKEEYLAINYLYKTYVNKTKLNNLISGLQYILSIIYTKKVELNIVNIKYMHLNSDIFTNAISIKLRNKASRVLEVLSKSLKLVKIPRKIITGDNTNNSKNNLIPLNKVYKGININGLYSIANRLNSKSFENPKDKITKILQNMFVGYEGSFNKLKENYYNLDLHTRILSSLNYKWITGARLETKGRLTKRFTASRSLFKFNYKGSLKNLSLQNKHTNNNYEIPNLHIIRNSMKPNIQYTLTSSKKRTGTFGLKGWISSN
jgi:hypothetical protein